MGLIKNKNKVLFTSPFCIYNNLVTISIFYLPPFGERFTQQTQGSMEHRTSNGISMFSIGPFLHERRGT
jgi:hypothetical protein